MYWLNVDTPTGIAKLHKEDCRFCMALETSKKSVNAYGDNGGWFSFDSIPDAREFFKTNHGEMIWMPCRACNPDKPV